MRCQITLATTVSFGFGAVFKFLFVTFFIFPIWHKHFGHEDMKHRVASLLGDYKYYAVVKYNVFTVPRIVP